MSTDRTTRTWGKVQSLANSWQQPIADEPGRGTMKRHIVLLVDDVDPNVAVTAVDCSGEVPLGTTTVLLCIDIEATGAGHQVDFYDDAGAGNKWGDIVIQVAGQPICVQLIVGLDADRKFYYQASHANVNHLTINLRAYWI